MREARGDFANFLHGSGIDIGCEFDPIHYPGLSVIYYNKSQGSGIKLPFPTGHFDFVYSSHCLEHMDSVGDTLNEWTRVLKVGGHLYITVPDYLLYEKLTWPSKFNGNHKHSFSCSITRAQVKRNDHWHIEMDLAPLLANMKMQRVTLEDDGFNYNLGPDKDQDALRQICVVATKYQAKGD